MTKRVRGGKEDEYRWYRVSGELNSEQFGVISGVQNTALAHVGGLVVLSADIEVPEIAGADTWTVEVMAYYNPVNSSPISQFFLPLGCTVVMGAPSIGNPAPTGNITVVFSLAAGSAGGSRVMWSSSAFTLDSPSPSLRVCSSTSDAVSPNGFAPIPIGINSANTDDSDNPYISMIFGIENLHMTNPVLTGWVRTVVWGVEA